MNHHPKWENVYGSLRVQLETHDVNGVSDFVSCMAADSIDERGGVMGLPCNRRSFSLTRLSVFFSAVCNGTAAQDIYMATQLETYVAATRKPNFAAAASSAASKK
jgi:hypothetical protein